MSHRKAGAPNPEPVFSEGDLPLDCPGCGYDLRGFAEPRCPECGARFDIRQLQAGTARAEQTTWLDRADVWQPHQLLIRSLYELIRGLFRPTSRLRHISVHTEPPNGALMLLCAEFWIILLCAAVFAVAIATRTGASPAAAVHAAFGVWTPVLLAVRLSLYVFLMWVAADPRLLRVADTPLRARMRVAGYWMPVIGFWCSAMQSVLIVAEPEFGLPMAWIAAAFAAGLALFSVFRAAGPRLRGIAPFATALCLLAGCAASVASQWLFPDTLMPPIRIFIP